MYNTSPQSAAYVYQSSLEKHSFDRCINLEYMYIGIYEIFFALNIESLLSVSLARFFFFVSF